LNLGGVKLGDLLPCAKREVAHAPVAQQSHHIYLQALILTATNQEKDFTGDWLRYFERKNMEREKGNFPGDLASLKQALKQPRDAGGAAKTSTADPNQVPARK
jgi:hypothetical protein